MAHSALKTDSQQNKEEIAQDNANTAPSHSPDEGKTAVIPSKEDDGATRAMDLEALEEERTQRIEQEEDDGQTTMVDSDSEGQMEQVALSETEIPTSPEITELQEAGRDSTHPQPGRKSKATVSFNVGYLLQDRYQLKKTLGKGGFGAAYLAEDIKLKRKCVVKEVIIYDRTEKHATTSRLNFEREASLLVQLNHPGHPSIPEIYDYFSGESSNYLVMKYIEGQNLKEALTQSEGALPWREVVRYAIDVCDALQYMHTRKDEPIIHRDIKPANILLGDDGRVWLVDFGLAKADPIEDSSDQTGTQAYGSFGYTPLEQWIGEAEPASDMYALGATLHHLMTGHDPIKAFGNRFTISKVKETHGRLPPIRKIDPNLPKQLEQMTSQATAAMPDKRPTILQFQQQLKLLISGAQQVALYSFKNGQSAQTVEELVELCDQNRREAEEYLQNGDFERWFLLLNRNDLAEAARQALKQENNRRNALEKFLKLILPNIHLIRLRKFLFHLVRGTVQTVLIALVIVLLLLIGGSYLMGWIIERTVSNYDWNFYTLETDRPNIFNEQYLNNKASSATKAYFNQVNVDVQPPDRINFEADVGGLFLLEVPATLHLNEGRFNLQLSEINDIPLWLVTDNISKGFNQGFDQVVDQAPVTFQELEVKDTALILAVEQNERWNPPTLSTPAMRSTPTPVPAELTLLAIFNKLEHDVVLEIEGRTWNIAAQEDIMIDIRPGTYAYTIRYQENGQLAYRGTETWELGAYRWRINLPEN